MFSKLKMSRPQTRPQKYLVTGVSLIILSIGIILLHRSTRSIKQPDLQQASPQQIADFLSGNYARLSSPHQQQFIRNLASWYLKVDAPQRRTFERNLRKTDISRHIKSQILTQVRVDTVHELAAQYAKLGPDEKQQFLAQTSFMLNVIGGKDKFHRYLDNTLWKKVIENPSAYHQNLNKYARELDQHSTAAQRARLIQLSHDLAVYNKLQSH